MDREKVIKGLEICYCPPAKCEDCPYHNLPDEQSCNDMLCLDALTLLKEQEVVVRCKDCKNNNQCSIQFKFANADNPDDWFCADGKR